MSMKKMRERGRKRGGRKREKLEVRKGKRERGKG